MRNEIYNKKPDGTRPTKIVEAAILHEGRIWTGKRHYELIYQIIRDYPECNHIPQNEQGFLTDNGLFVSRTTARHIAILAGQLPNDFAKILLSEHLW